MPAGPEGSCVYATNYGICKSCYARANRYNTDVVAKAQWIRYQWWKTLVKDDPGAVINVLSYAINRYCTNKYFRIYDSGDISEPRDYIIWSGIVKNCKDIKFWMPTRTWRSKSKAWQEGLEALAALPNITVRGSALEFDEPIEKIYALERPLPVSSVSTSTQAVPDGWALCPKSENGTSCIEENCRVCWDSPEVPVTYLVHGMMGRHKKFEITDKMMRQRIRFKEEIVNLTVKGENNVGSK